VERLALFVEMAGAQGTNDVEIAAAPAPPMIRSLQQHVS
jgi:hypothetical protein